MAPVDVQGSLYRFHVAAVERRGARARRRRAAVRRAARAGAADPGRQPLRPNRFLIAGAGADPEALRRAGDAGQREYLAGGDRQPRRPTGAMPPTTVIDLGGAPGGAGGQRRQRGAQLHLRRRRAPGGRARAAGRRVRGAGRGAGARGRCCPGCGPWGCPAAGAAACWSTSWYRCWRSPCWPAAWSGVACRGCSGPRSGCPRSPRAWPPAAASTRRWSRRRRWPPWCSPSAAALLVENVVNRRLRLGEALRLGEEN